MACNAFANSVTGFSLIMAMEAGWSGRNPGGGLATSRWNERFRRRGEWKPTDAAAHLIELDCAEFSHRVAFLTVHVE